MPVTPIDATPGSAVANAYVTLAVADQYHLDRPAVGATWADASSDSKTAAILWATKLLDSPSNWIWSEGYPTTPTQALLWPRAGVIKRNGWEYVPDSAVPIEVQHATAEYARQLLVSDMAGNSDVETQGIKQITADVVTLIFKDGVKPKPVPDTVVYLIPTHWGYPAGRAPLVPVRT
ncbi:MAG TPA: DnaT-like ssDNA-binding protein [Gemmatimonadaceae bacterium]|nr:DnaT-like ssDNA-binding protein [Gemmatimonadaceae bacterium]